jgi:zinc transport system permease protein
MQDFFVRALLGGVGVALVTGPVGCFILWRRMVVFGAALSHSALLGVVLGLGLGIGVTPGALIVCIGVALAFLALSRDGRVSEDAVLNIVAHAALALGLIFLTLFSSITGELIGFLFGDILAVSSADLGWIWGGGAVVLAVLIALWRPMLGVTVHEELAAVEGLPVQALRVIFLLLVSVVTAVALKIVGALLIIALLVVPAAAARRLSTTPESMAVTAAGVGVVAVVVGLWSSLWWDLPASPAIVLAATLLFAGSLVIGRPLRTS